jgi:hypothetical protein
MKNKCNFIILLYISINTNINLNSDNMKVDKIAITQKLISNKCAIDGDVKERWISTGDDGVDNNSVTSVPFYPLKDKVIIKAIFEESILVVKDEKSVRQSNPKLQIVVGYGDEVKNLRIGDVVKTSINSTIEPIEFEGNDKSIKKMMKEAMDVKPTPFNSNIKVIMIEYYVVHLFSILGIYE